MKIRIEVSSAEEGSSRPSMFTELNEENFGGGKKIIDLLRENPEKLFGIVSGKVEGRIHDLMAVIETEDSGIPVEIRVHFSKEKGKVINDFITVYFYEKDLPAARVYIEPLTESIFVCEDQRERRIKAHDAYLYRERILKAISEGESLFETLPLVKRKRATSSEKTRTTSLSEEKKVMKRSPKARNVVNLFSLAEK